jgi:hypothetical protein
MIRFSNSRVLFAVTLLTLFAGLPLVAQIPASAPDSGLYTNYYGTPTSVHWIVCGSTEQTEGCYDSGDIGPFVAVGAMLESNPSVDGDVVTRFIYVVDSGASPVSLYVYKKTDTVSSTFDTTVITLYKTISLSALVGGANLTTYMAGNLKYLYIGTSLSPNAVSVNKVTLKVSELSGFSPPADVTSITSDEYGYVTVTQGTAFTVYDSDGSFVEDGGGTQFMLGTTQAVPAASILIGDFVQTPHFRLKTQAPISANQQ